MTKRKNPLSTSFFSSCIGSFQVFVWSDEAGDALLSERPYHASYCAPVPPLKHSCSSARLWNAPSAPTYVPSTNKAPTVGFLGHGGLGLLQDERGLGSEWSLNVKLTGEVGDEVRRHHCVESKLIISPVRQRLTLYPSLPAARRLLRRRGPGKPSGAQTRRFGRFSLVWTLQTFNLEQTEGQTKKHNMGTSS